MSVTQLQCKLCTPQAASIRSKFLLLQSLHGGMYEMTHDTVDDSEHIKRDLGKNIVNYDRGWLAVCPSSPTNRIKMERNACLHTPLLVRIRFCCSHPEPRLLACCRTMALAGFVCARRNSQRTDPIIVICTF